VDEFLATQGSLKGPGVEGWWVRVLGEVDEARRESLLAAARDPRISHRAIALVLQGWGFAASVAQVGHWRRTHVG